MSDNALESIVENIDQPKKNRTKKGRRRKRNKLPPEPVQLEIRSLSHEGRGIADLEGKTVFVYNALPGETVVAKITESRSKYQVAEAIEIIQKSDDRQPEACIHASFCGGCSLHHMKSEAQLTFKEATLREHFKHFGGIQFSDFKPRVESPSLGYRYKARLAVRYVPKKGGVLVGFREKSSHFVAEIDQCPVLVPLLSDLIEPLKVCLTGLDAKDKLPQIEVAAGLESLVADRETCALIFRHLEPLSDRDLEALLCFAQKHQIEAYLQPKGPDTVHKIWPQNTPERLYYKMPDLSLKMAFHPLDFTQVNPYINRPMVIEAIQQLAPGPEEKVLDLFCGLGNFTLALARKAKKVVGVEMSTEMVKRGHENAALNQCDNVSFYAADLASDHFIAALKNRDTSDYPWLADKYHKALIDPPRSGAEAVLQCLPELGVKALVYVSCNPATLARDAGILARLGYRLINVGIMDMFPHTAHVEAIAYFEQAL